MISQVNLRSQTANSMSDKKQISALESKISKLQVDVDKLHAETAIRDRPERVRRNPLYRGSVLAF